MTTRKELGAALMLAIGKLRDDIYEEHRFYSGWTYIGNETRDYVQRRCSFFRKRLEEVIGNEAKEYLALAPEMCGQFQNDTYLIEDSIREFEQSIISVYHSTKMRQRELDDPLRPTAPGFCRRTGPNERQTVHDETVPVIQHAQGTIFGIFPISVPMIAGYKTRRVVRSYNNRGHMTTMQIYSE